MLSEIDEKDHRQLNTNVIAKKPTKQPLKHSGGGSTKRNNSGNSRLESEPTFDRTVSAVEPTSYHHRRQSNFSSSTASNLQPTISTASIPSQSSLNFDFYLIHIFKWKIRQDTFLKVVLVL